MSDKTNSQTKAMHPAETITLKTLGYLLILLGVGSVVYVGYHVWEIYNHPELVNRLAQSLEDAANQNDVPFSILKIAAWQIVVILMLTAGKVAIWFIEAGQRLVSTR